MLAAGGGLLLPVLAASEAGRPAAAAAAAAASAAKVFLPFPIEIGLPLPLRFLGVPSGLSLIEEAGFAPCTGPEPALAFELPPLAPI